MIYSALSSAAMLGASSDQILDAATALAVHGVEWSMDGALDFDDAERAGALMLSTLNARLSITSFSTLFRAGLHADSHFAGVLSTARALQAPIVRMWSAPKTKSPKKDTKKFLETARILGDQASSLGITICFGVAEGSVLDSYKAAAKLFKTLGHPFVKIVWEPSALQGFDQVMDSFSGISGHVGLLVARFLDSRGVPLALRRREEDWISYLDAFDEQGGNPDMPRYVVLRAIKNNDHAHLLDDVRFINYYSGQLRRLHRRRAL